MALTVLITLTSAGSDTGPFDLYSDVDGYIVPFESAVPKASLLAGYSSTVVPDGTTIIRVKSVSVLCTNYIDLPVAGATTTTTTTTTAPFSCADCRNWQYVGETIPVEGGVINYYRCSDGAPQTIVLSSGDPSGSLCNCNSSGTPTGGGITLTEVGICVP